MHFRLDEAPTTELRVLAVVVQVEPCTILDVMRGLPERTHEGIGISLHQLVTLGLAWFDGNYVHCAHRKEILEWFRQHRPELLSRQQ